MIARTINPNSHRGKIRLAAMGPSIVLSRDRYARMCPIPLESWAIAYEHFFRRPDSRGVTPALWPKARVEGPPVNDKPQIVERRSLRFASLRSGRRGDAIALSSPGGYCGVRAYIGRE